MKEIIINTQTGQITERDMTQEELAQMQAIENDIDAAKERKLQEIAEYDSSDAVNQFIYHGIPMWLDKDLRLELLFRFESEKEQGRTETTLWYDNRIPITLGIDDAIQMIKKLQVYASDTFDKTAEHIAEVNALTDLDAINNYDVTKDYPSKLIM